MVHDELVFEVPEEDAQEAADIIRDEMEAAGREYLTCVPVIIHMNNEPEDPTGVIILDRGMNKEECKAMCTSPPRSPYGKSFSSG